jgi:hypothetical protein
MTIGDRNGQLTDEQTRQGNGCQQPQLWHGGITHFLWASVVATTLGPGTYPSPFDSQEEDKLSEIVTGACSNDLGK